jgi:glucose/arabinose dehydrogenase
MFPVHARCFGWFTALFTTFASALLPAATLPSGFIDVVVASGFTNVSSMALAPDGRIFVGQQNGLVRVVKEGAILPAPLLSLGVNTIVERGLLGIALDPGFASNGFVYGHYTTNAPIVDSVVQRISRFTADGDSVAPGSERVLFETDPFTAQRELGGGLGFGSDGMLYIGIGQSAASANSQATNNHFGKILRIQPDGAIPADNPFFGINTGKNRAVWALGLRNPFVIAFQPGTGRLFINDVGSDGTIAREEINEGVAGANYGWPACEGACGIANPALRDPLHFYTHGFGFNGITGGAFYNPATRLYPAEYVGKYFFGDLATATIRMLDPATTNAVGFASGLVGRLVSLKVGSDGALYYLAQSASAFGGGLVGKIVPGAQTLFPLGASWKYLDSGITNIPAGWTQPGFDDSSWSNGIAQFGYGDGGETTLIRGTRIPEGTRIITTYFRKTFVLANPAAYASYVISLVRDDGAVVYLNGDEVFRSNLPTGIVTSVTLAPIAVATIAGAADDESATFGAMVSPARFVSGSNLLAVELHQQTAASTDLSFDLALHGLDPAPTLTASAFNDRIVLRYPSWAAAFVLESTPVLPAAGWFAVTNLAVDAGEFFEVTTDSANGQRFFRLRRP